MAKLAKMEGISAEPAAAVAFAGMFKLIRAGVIKPTDTVIVNCTGHTVPAEAFILGSGWAKSIIMPGKDEQPPKEEEGLLAALNRVAPDRFPHIAIIDDTAEARRLMRRILQSQGNYVISEAAGGKKGLELITSERPDLIILDVELPDINGYEICRRLREDVTTRNLPIIMLTVKGSLVDELTGLSIGADDYLTKLSNRHS